MSVWHAATQLPLPGAIPHQLNNMDPICSCSSGLVLARSFSSEPTNQTRRLVEGTHNGVELRRARHQRRTLSRSTLSLKSSSTPGLEAAGLQEHATTPSRQPNTLSASNVHDSSFTVYEGVHNWHLFSHLWRRLLNSMKTMQMLYNRHTTWKCNNFRGKVS
jgi:hypothetical protein